MLIQRWLCAVKLLKERCQKEQFLLPAVIAISLALLMSLASGQQPLFVEPAKNVALTPEQQGVLSAIYKMPTSQEIEIIRVNASLLTNSDHVVIKLRSNALLSIANSSREYRDGTIVGWSGTARDSAKGSTSMAVNGGNVTASIQAPDGLYRIRPLGGGLHALIKVDSAKFPAEHPPGTKDKSRGR